MNLMGSSASLWDPNSGLTSVKNVNWILMWPNLWKKRNWTSGEYTVEIPRPGKFYQGPSLKTHFRHFPCALNSKLYYSFQSPHGVYAWCLQKQTNKRSRVHTVKGMIKPRLLYQVVWVTALRMFSCALMSAVSITYCGFIYRSSTLCRHFSCSCSDLSRWPSSYEYFAFNVWYCKKGTPSLSQFTGLI